MTNLQAAQYDSIVAVKQLLEAHPTVRASMPALTAAYTQLAGKVSKLEEQITQQDADYSGNTLEKAGARKNAIDRLVPLAASLYAYAQVTEHRNLAGEVKVTPSELRNMRDDEFRGRADRLLKAAASVPLAELQPYNATAETIGEAQDFFDAWCRLQSTVRNAIALSEDATRKIASLLPEIQSFLAERMDPMMLVVSLQHPDVAGQYEIVRELVDPATQTRALTVTVTTIQGGPQPVAGAEGVLNPGGITKTTGPQGQFYVQDLAPGSYTLTLSKAGFATAGPIPVHITAGEMASATVVLEAA